MKRWCKWQMKMDLSRQAVSQHVPEKLASCKHLPCLRPASCLRYSIRLKIWTHFLLGLIHDVCVLDRCIPLIHAADLTWMAPTHSQIPIHLAKKPNQTFGENSFYLLSWRLPYFAIAISEGQALATISNPRHHGTFQIFEHAKIINIFKINSPPFGCRALIKFT